MLKPLVNKEKKTGQPEKGRHSSGATSYEELRRNESGEESKLIMQPKIAIQHNWHPYSIQ